MSLNTRITRYTVTTAALGISIGSGKSKVILQAGDADIYMAYDPLDFDNEKYFTVQAGTSIILDQPVPSQTQLVYVQSTGTTTLEVWIT